MDLNRVIDKTKYGADDVPMYPAKTLVSHVALRGAQLGSVLGLFVGTPVLCFLKKTSLSQAWLKVLPASATLTGLVVTGYTFYKHWDDVDGVDDRAYRISQNMAQTKVDEFAMYGSIAGVGGGVLLAPKFGHRGVIAGTYTGLTVGLIAYMIQKKFNEVVNGKPSL